MNCKNVFVQLDQFGALFQLSFQANSSSYRSLLGAITTLLLYISSLSYFAYLLYIWLQGEQNPKVTQFFVFQSQGKTYHLQNSPFYVNFEAYDSESLNLLKEKTFFSYKSKFFTNGTIINFEDYSPKCQSIDLKTYTLDAVKPLCLENSDQRQSKLTQYSKNRSLDDYLGYFVFPCSDKEDPKCVNQSIAEEYFTSLGDARLSYFIEEFNYQTQKLETIPTDFYFPIRKAERIVLNVLLQISQLTVIKGIIFPTYEYYEYINHIEIKTTQVNRSEEDSYAAIWISLNRTEKQIKIEYPKLPEVLAQFSTIFSGLMALGIICNLFNRHYLKKQISNSLADIYFQNYDEYFSKDKKNKQLKKKIDAQLIHKCSLLNIVYEISKLQIAVQMILAKEKIEAIQSIKYMIINQNDDYFFQDKLTLKDFTIFSWNENQKKNKKMKQIRNKLDSEGEQKIQINLKTEDNKQQEEQKQNKLTTDFKKSISEEIAKETKQQYKNITQNKLEAQ